MASQWIRQLFRPEPRGRWIGDSLVTLAVGVAGIVTAKLRNSMIEGFVMALVVSLIGDALSTMIVKRRRRGP
jgi:hypothetical protein